MKKKKYIILFCVILLFGFLIYFVRRPVTVAMVADKLPAGSPWREDIKEIEVENLHEKMGLQLFRLEMKTEYGREFFLVNRFQYSELLYFSGKAGNCYCMDYDKNGKWEFLYLSKDGMRSLCVPQLYIYGLQGGKINLEGVYTLEGARIPVDEPALSVQKDGNLYINYDKDHPENNVYLQYKKGKLFCYGEKKKKLEVTDDTESYRKKETLKFSDLK